MKDPMVLAMEDAIRNEAKAWFVSPHCKIWPKNRGGGLITPRSNYLQKKIQETVNRFEELQLPIRIIGLKPRQKGSTTFFSALDYTQLRRQAAHACVIGGQLSQTKEVIEMLKTYQENDRFDWKNTGEINSVEGRWSNGSRLKFETAGDKLAGVAGTYQVLHATEAARWARYGVANAADVLANILKCVPLMPATMIILESTAEGQSGDFYTRWIGGVDTEDFISGKVTIQPGQYVRVFAPWFEFDDSAMRITEEQKQYIRSTLDSEEEYIGEQELIDLYSRDDEGTKRLGTVVDDFDVWEQLAWRRWAIREECKRDKNIFDRDYPKSWLTAFQSSGNLRFNQTGMAMMRKRLALCTPVHGIIEEPSPRRFAFRQTDRGEAKVTIFEKPTRGYRYLLTCDPMTGETQVGGIDPDRHGVFVMRAGLWDEKGQWKKMATAARLVQNRWDIDVLEKNIWPLACLYGGASGCLIAIEMNQDRGLTELLKLRGANLYMREIFNQREMRMSKALGYQTNEKTREVLIERLAQVIREWDKPGDGIDIWCPLALEQCENFVRKANGRSEAAEGWKDDDVFSIGLGSELIDQATIFMPPRGPFSYLDPHGSPREAQQQQATAYS